MDLKAEHVCARCRAPVYFDGWGNPRFTCRGHVQNAIDVRVAAQPVLPLITAWSPYP